MTFYDKSRSSVDHDGHRWGRVKKIKDCKTKRVYNIEVEEDNSYVAEGIVVHNCQSFSVAGLRKGLDDPRGGLMLDYVNIARRYRPRWVVWENVPGVLTSNRGRDFGTLLGALGDLGYQLAYRVLDAQWIRTQQFPHAVPQRRRRVFVVGYLGDRNRAAEVLFKQESVRRDSTPSRRSFKSPAPNPGEGTEGGGGERDADPGGADGVATFVKSTCPHSKYEAPTFVQTDVAYTLTAWDEHRMPPKHMAVDVRNGVITDQVAHTLQSHHRSASLNSQPAVLHPMAVDARHGTVDHVAMTIQSNPRSLNAQPTVLEMLVRRLLPEEAEALQGFPHGHTAVVYKGKHAADNMRYKALGNSMAVNCMAWIGQRVAAAE